MAKTKQTTVEIRKLVILHYKNGKSQREIAKIVSRSRTTVQSIINRYNVDGRIENKPRVSSKKIFNEADERWLVRMVKNDPKLSAPKLAVEAGKYLHKKANPETVRRVLRKSNLHGRVARRKPFVSPKNIKSRMEFARTHVDKDFNFWKHVMFTDESKFNIFGSDGRIMVWRKPNEELKRKNLRATVKHGGGSVMVWGCMSAAGVGNLHFIDGIMDQYVYLDILKKNVKASAKKLGISRTFHFYQDNDPKHTAAKPMAWLIQNCPNVMKPPAQSPDLNVIENLWHQLEINIRKHQITNKELLKGALELEWKNLSSSYTEKLVRSMPNRLTEVLKNKGLPIRY